MTWREDDEKVAKTVGIIMFMGFVLGLVLSWVLQL